MKKLILLCACVLGLAQAGFTARGLNDPELSEKLDDCLQAMPMPEVCDPKTQHKCKQRGGYRCKGVEYFYEYDACCAGVEDEGDVGLITERLICEEFTSKAGHNVPSTVIGNSVKIGCFTYACDFALKDGNGGWTTSSSGCSCKPNATYYQPCGDCGTQTGVCSKDGSGIIWQLCDEPTIKDIKDIGDIGKVVTPALQP
jgi:hypothetical protein